MLYVTQLLCSITSPLYHDIHRTFPCSLTRTVLGTRTQFDGLIWSLWQRATLNHAPNHFTFPVCTSSRCRLSSSRPRNNSFLGLLVSAQRIWRGYVLKSTAQLPTCTRFMRSSTTDQFLQRQSCTRNTRVRRCGQWCRHSTLSGGLSKCVAYIILICLTILDGSRLTQKYSISKDSLFLLSTATCTSEPQYLPRNNQN